MILYINMLNAFLCFFNFECVFAGWVDPMNNLSVLVPNIGINGSSLNTSTYNLWYVWFLSIIVDDTADIDIGKNDVDVVDDDDEEEDSDDVHLH